METNRVLDRGSHLLIPYQETTNITISSKGFDDFDLAGLENNRTGKYGGCLNIIKYLSGGNLRIRAIRSSNDSFIITYKNNGIKDKVVINGEEIEINLDDTTITLNINDDMKMQIHIISNEEVINQEAIKEEKSKKEDLEKQHTSLKEQYEKIKQENELLVKDNEQLKQNYQTLQKQNEAIIKEIDNYKKDIKELNETFNQNKNQNDLLQKQFDGTLRHYGITKDVFNEYKEENNSQKIKEILSDIQTELKEAEELLKEYIENKQKRVDQIRQMIKPE